MIDCMLRQNALCSLVVHCTSMEVLFTFLITLTPYSRRCPRLIKAKVVKPHLHYQFLCAHYEKCLPSGSIGLNALEVDAPIYAIASAIVQLESSIPSIGKIVILRLVCPVQDLEHAARCYNIFGKNCLPFNLHLLWKIHTGFLTIDTTILPSTLTP